MTQRRINLLLLVFCFTPIVAYDFNDITDFTDEINITRKPFNSLQVAGPAIVTGLTSLNALNVKQGADFGGDVVVDGNMFVDGGIVLDSCLVLTCTSAGQLLINGIAVSSSTNVNLCDAIPLTVSITGTTITNPGYYCLVKTATGVPLPTAAVITIASNDVTLDLNNQTIVPGSGVDGIDVSASFSRITIKNGTLSMSTSGAIGINLYGLAGDSDFHIHDVNIDGAAYGIATGNMGTTTPGVTNLDIARVIVTNSTSAGFNIYEAANLTISECNISGDTPAGGFVIFGATGSSAFVNSCVAAGNIPGFYISGSNVTLTNCVAQTNVTGFELGGTSIALANCIANFNSSIGFYTNGSQTTFTNCTAQGNGTTPSTDAGFYLDTASSGIMLAHCTANDNNGDGFVNDSTFADGRFNFIACMAQNNTGDGFNLVNNTTGGGLIKSCLAEGNAGCGFNDASSSNYQYVANVAEGNHVEGYCLSGTPQLPYPNGPLTAPFYLYRPNKSGTGFVPTYWNNVTLPLPPV